MRGLDTTRNYRGVTREEVETHYKVLGIDGLDEHKGLDGWRKCQVKVSALRNMYGAFGRKEDGFIDLPKGERLQKQLEHYRQLVDSVAFPRAELIKKDWPDKPALIVQQTKSSGELYVSDGVTRTFNACYHDETWLDAYIIELDQERDVID